MQAISWAISRTGSERFLNAFLNAFLNVGPGCRLGREVRRPGSYVFRKHRQAVRSAIGGWGWLPSPNAPTIGTFQAEECNAFGLTTDVHGLSNVSGTATTWAVVRTHSSPSLLSIVQRFRRSAQQK